MPLLCCTECHHEWENSTATASEPGTCGWCKSPGRLLAATTPLEVFVGSGECLRIAKELCEKRLDSEATSKSPCIAVADE